MQKSEMIFSAVAKIESEVLSSWASGNLAAKLSESRSKLEGDFNNEKSAIISAAVIALGLVGGVINKEIDTRKAQKLVDGGAYVMIDLMAQQIALKSHLANLVSGAASAARWEGLLLNLKELVRGASRLESLSTQLDKFGHLASFALVCLEQSGAAGGLNGALKHEVSALAA
jgi:hypothetical protein